MSGVECELQSSYLNHILQLCMHLCDISSEAECVSMSNKYMSLCVAGGAAQEAPEQGVHRAESVPDGGGAVDLLGSAEREEGSG